MNSTTPPRRPADPAPNAVRETVEITVDTVGTVRVGPPPVAAPFGVPLPVGGGVAVFDACAPHRPPYLELDGDTEENWTLPLTFGEPATAEAALARGEAAVVPVAPTDPVDHVLARRTVPWRPGGRWLPTARLALLLWLSRWSPVPLEPALLDIEIGTLLCAAEGVVDDSHDLARARFARSARRLVELAAVLFEGPPLPGERWVVELLADALECAADCLVGHELHSRVLELSERAGDLERGPQFDEVLESELRELLRPQEVFRWSSDGGRWNKADTDWAQVPPGLLSTAEHAVLWRVQQGPGGEELVVRAAAAPTTLDEAGPLAFRVYAPDGGLPLLRGRLLLRRSGGGFEWYGSAPLRGRMPSAGLTVDVYHPEHVVAPRVGGAARQAAAQRRAVHYLSSLRDHLARQDWLELGRWAEIVSLDAEVQSSRIASLTAGARTAAAELRRRERGGAGPDDGNPSPLLAPVWRPALAEWGRLRPNFGL